MRFYRIFVGFLASGSFSRELWAEERLQHELFDDYNRDVRPINMGEILKADEEAEGSAGYTVLDPLTGKPSDGKGPSAGSPSGVPNLDGFIRGKCRKFIGKNPTIL